MKFKCKKEIETHNGNENYKDVEARSMQKTPKRVCKPSWHFNFVKLIVLRFCFFWRMSPK
jgi:hypothetical protein